MNLDALINITDLGPSTFTKGTGGGRLCHHATRELQKFEANESERMGKSVSTKRKAVIRFWVSREDSHMR